MTKVFIDGKAGTTGLRIYERLAQRQDLELIVLPEDLRKDPAAKAEAFAKADIAFLCLPDAAAKEAAELAGDTAVIDTSTAHRTAEGWTYGFPELMGQTEKIAESKRIANPGCHASGFVSLVAPLVAEGLISPDTALTCFSVTGYSGGGKKMIADYESKDRPQALDSPKQYGLGQDHKHLPEMQKICGLKTAPVFCPVVSDFYSGMTVTVPLFKKDLNGNMAGIEEVYRRWYSGKLVRFERCPDGGVFGNMLSGRDDMVVTVAGNEDRILLISCFDNLGKGASGAAVQNMNILLGLPQETGLVI